MTILHKFPSFDNLVKGAGSTLARFPFALLSAIVAATLFAILIELDGGDQEYMLRRLAMAVGLGLPLFIAMTAFAEKQRWPRKTALAYQFIGVGLLAAYFLSLPQDTVISKPDYLRYQMLAAGVHFLVSFLPYLGGDQVLGFWQYNKHLFLRFLMATLFASTLYIGLAIAMASADQLFGIDIDSDRYFQLWILVSGVFHPWFFLAGFPKNLEQLNTSAEYPKGLRIFTQYVLLPLVGLYFVILYAYEAKIIITWNWPKGWVSQLVLWFSVVGTFSLLLLHPLRNKSENAWIRVFSKWFFRALIPLVVMLFLAISRRVMDYGITEHRYIVFALAIGLAVVVLYFVISKTKDIRVIPIVLCAIAFLPAYGPWGAFSVSGRSQQSRLTELLKTNQMLVDGKLQTSAETLSNSTRKNMSSIVDYLSNWHDLESFTEWLPDSLLTFPDTLPEGTKLERITSMLGFEYVSRWTTLGDKEHFFLRNEAVDDPLSISGYDFLVKLNKLSDSMGHSYAMGQLSCFVSYDRKQSVVLVRVRSDSGIEEELEFSLAGLVMNVLDENITNKATLEQMTFSQSGQSFDARIILMNISGVRRPDEFDLTVSQAVLLINEK